MTPDDDIQFCLSYKNLLKVLEVHLTSYWEIEISKQERWPRESIKLNQCCLNIVRYMHDLENQPLSNSAEALGLFSKFEDSIKAGSLKREAFEQSSLNINLRLYLNQFNPILVRNARSSGAEENLKISENLQKKLKEESFKLNSCGAKADKQQAAWGDFKQAVGYVESCFKDCPNLYVLCMEFGYQGRKQDNDLAPNADDPKWLYGINNKFNQTLNHLPKIVGYFQRPVFCFGKGFSLQYVFLLSHNQNNSELEWVRKLGQCWRNIHLDHHDLYKISSYCNTNSVFAKFSRGCVGAISKGQTKRIQAFLKWVLEYLVRMPLYLPVDISFLDIDNRFPLIGQLDHPYLFRSQAVALPLPALTQITLSARDQANLWKLSTIPDWRNLKRKLSEINIIYDEHYQRRLKGIMDLDPFLVLRDIESCMACIRYSSFSAFHAGHAMTDGTGATKAMTPIGKQLLFLYWHSGFEKLWSIDESLFKKMSLSVLIFIYAIHHNKAKPEIMKSAPLYPFMQTLNLIVQTIHGFLSQKDPKIINVWIDQYKGYSYTDALKQTILTQEKKNKFCSVGELLKNQEDSRDKSFKSALAYINGLIKKPVHLFAVKLYPDFSLKTTTDRQMCSDMLSGYLDNTKASHLGYIGGWEISGSERDHAFVIFFLSAASNANVNELGEAIKKSWTCFFHGDVVKRIKAKHKSSTNEKPAEVEKKDHSDLQPDASPVAMFSQDGTDNLVNYYFISKPLSNKDKELIYRLSLYLSTRELYFNSESMDLKKRIIKGASKKQPALKRTSPFYTKPRKKNAEQNSHTPERPVEPDPKLPVTDAEPTTLLTEIPTPNSESPVETSVNPVETDNEVRQRAVNREIRKRNYRSINLPPSPQPLTPNEQDVPPSETGSDASIKAKDDRRNVKSNVNTEIRKKHQSIIRPSSPQPLEDTPSIQSSDPSS